MTQTNTQPPVIPEGVDLTSPFEVFKHQIGAVMKFNNIVSAVVEFAGSGDSGSIDGVNFMRGTATEVQFVGEEEDVLTNMQMFSPRQNTAELMTLPEAVTRISDTVLEMTGEDWYNNDGGQGTIMFIFSDGSHDLEPGTFVIEVEMGINYTEVRSETFEY